MEGVAKPAIGDLVGGGDRHDVRHLQPLRHLRRRELGAARSAADDYSDILLLNEALLLGGRQAGVRLVVRPAQLDRRSAKALDPAGRVDLVDREANPRLHQRPDLPHWPRAGNVDADEHRRLSERRSRERSQCERNDLPLGDHLSSPSNGT